MRIVSLCPSLTELVFDLGLGANLVGRTKFCIHPSDGVATVEKIGGTKNPKIDRIIELAPDLEVEPQRLGHHRQCDRARRLLRHTGGRWARPAPPATPGCGH